MATSAIRTCAGVSFLDELQCSICLDSWVEPTEVVPCGHIFCRTCIAEMDNCPLCRLPIAKKQLPNRLLVNLAAAVQVKCSQCGWQGSRQKSISHICNGAATGNGDENCNSNSSPTEPPPQRYSVIQPTGPRPWEAYRLSQEEYDQIMSLFFTFDETESGTLDRRELGRLARCLNFVRSPSEVDAIFRDMDSDGNGTLSMAEFCTWLTYNKPDPSALYGLTQSEYNTVMMQFFTYDTDQDGLLDVAQFERLVRSLGFSGTSAQAAQLFQCIDKDFNGHVDLHEFLSYQAVRKARGLGVLSTRKRT